MTVQSTGTSRRRMLEFAVALPVATALASQAAAAAVPTLPQATKEVKPFKVSVPQAAIDDLKRRLRNTRWPEKETASGWS